MEVILEITYYDSTKEITIVITLLITTHQEWGCVFD